MCIDIGQNYTTADVISKYMCNSNGILCEYATDRGYCKVTACLKRDTVSYTHLTLPTICSV